MTIAEKLGSASLMNWIERFGYGKTTGIDFPGESAGLRAAAREVVRSTIGNVPIGQGIAVTPIQMAAAYGAIANGGVWVQPHLVERVGGSVCHDFKRRRVVTPAIDNVLKTMLTGVVDEHGATGNAAAIPGYTVAGKTGTAQVPGPARLHDGQVRRVVRRHGAGQEAAARGARCRRTSRRAAIFGGTVAAPAFAEIAKFDLQYLGVPPDDRDARVRSRRS